MKSTKGKGLLRRALPFFAAFTVALFVTSFFVDISRPRFGGHKARKFQEVQRLRIENEGLKNENLRLKNEMESLRWDSMRVKHPGHEEWLEQNLDEMVPPPAIAPVAPKAAK